MLTSLLIGIVALLHFGFMLLEIYFWTKPLGRKIFKISQQQANETAVLAANQGIYNGILCAGLIWSITEPKAQLFFLSSVVVAGVFGALTVHRRIFWVQAFPALIGLFLVYLGT